MKKQRKRLKLPNGYGSVTMRKDTRRRTPGIVRVPINGKQVTIGYVATYEDGLAMLAEYHKDPTRFINNNITFADVYRFMRAEHWPKIAASTAKNYESAYKHLSCLYKKKFIELRTGDLQSAILQAEKNGAGYGMQKKIRQVMHFCYNYAVKYNIIKPDMDYSRYVEIGQHKILYPKSPFNTRQLNRVKGLITTDNPLAKWAMCVVMMCYSGVRPSEFLSIVKKDVKIRPRYFIVRDSKTEAGKNRPVPISKKTSVYFQYWINQPGKYLITDEKGNRLNYSRFRNRFDKVMKASRCKHTPHECRHTCATLLDNANANETAVKRILGHASEGVTKRVYTHKSLHELKRAIDMI